MEGGLGGVTVKWWHSSGDSRQEEGGKRAKTIKISALQDGKPQ